MNLVHTFATDSNTQNAGTVIVETIPPYANTRARVTSIDYEAGATAHTLRIMKALARTTTTASALASGTELTLSSLSFVGDTVAANDYLVVKHGNTYAAYLVSAVSGSTVTIPALAAAVSSGAPVWIMGEIGNSRHLAITAKASTRALMYDFAAGLASAGFDDGTYSRTGFADPLMIYSNNATNAGTLYRTSTAYCRS